MLLLFLLIACVLCAREECGSQHVTNYYTSHPNGIPSSFYNPSTASSYEDRCTPITNQEMRKTYNVGPNDQVEHIVDSNNGPLELHDCNKDIRGNKIIAYGVWNNQAGQLCWKDAEAEKRKVYGDWIFDNAYNAVKECCNGRTESALPYIILSFFFIFIVIGSMIYSVRRISAKDEPKYELISVGASDMESKD
jgi:hypothetical protein